MQLDQTKLTDRELLLILHTNVGTLQTDVTEIKDSTKVEIAGLKAVVETLKEIKADKTQIVLLEKENERQSKAISKLYNYLWFAWGALAILQVALTIWLSTK